MRLLVTGGREFDRTARLWQILDGYLKQHGVEGLVIVHGYCPRGADAMADQWARAHGITVERHPAHWTTYGKRAGYIRNQEMVDSRPDECVAFPDPSSVGTWDCIDRAETAGIKTRIFDPRTGRELP